MMMKRSGLGRTTLSDFRGLGGAAFMLAFACIAGWRWAHTGRLFYALLLFRDALWSVFLVTRRPVSTTGSRGEALLAYISTGLPLMYSSPGGMMEAWRPLLADTLAVAGFLLSTLATIELGTHVGVSPAARGEECRSGVYRWLRHPMYSGYVIAEASWILLWPGNALLFALSATLYLARMRAETRLLKRARFVPA